MMGKRKKLKDIIHRKIKMIRHSSEKVLVRNYEEKKEPASLPIPFHPPKKAYIPPLSETVQEIDFSMDKNLERYVNQLNIHYTTIEKWISAGILLPKELMVAQKMIGLLRKKDKKLKKF